MDCFEKCSTSPLARRALHEGEQLLAAQLVVFSQGGSGACGTTFVVNIFVALLCGFTFCKLNLRGRRESISRGDISLSSRIPRVFIISSTHFVTNLLGRLTIIREE